MTRVTEWEAAAREMGYDAAARAEPPISIARAVTGLRDPEGWLVEMLADAWEQGAADQAREKEQAR